MAKARKEHALSAKSEAAKAAAIADELEATSKNVAAMRQLQQMQAEEHKQDSQSKP